VSPQRAWNAFYKDGFSLMDSWCIGKRCEDPAWDEEETEGVEKKEVGENKKLEKSEKVDEDLNNSSEKSESPYLSADSQLPISSCLSPSWGSQLPDSVLHQEVTNPPFQSMQYEFWWRPWETDVMVPNMRSDENKVEGITDAGMDHSTNSTECPLSPAAELLPPPHLTPSKAAFSPFYPSPPHGRLLRRARKHKSSSGDLLRRRQRLIAYQLNHTPPSTPSKPEPDQSSLESGSLGRNSGSWSLGSHLEEESYPSNSTLLPPWSPQPWWSSPGWETPPPPGPPPSPTWLPSNMTPPSSPAFCDGCQRWGNLLSVTVSQTRAH
jgi:hypothetical protein